MYALFKTFLFAHLCMNLNFIPSLFQEPFISFSFNLHFNTQQLQISSLLMDSILSQYKIIKKLGRGAYGDVILAQNPLQAYVAIKIICKKVISKQPFMEQYLKSQKEAMMSFKSKYIVELFDFLEDSENIYFICEYCEGGDLYNFLAQQKNKVFSLEMTIKIMSQVINGLLLLHEKGYLHRDIKPQNILIKKDQDGNNQFKIADFGFSKKIERVQGTVVGTEPFMSPEIFENENYGFEADVWAFGVCMYFLLNMSYPFSINPHQDNKKKAEMLKKLSKNFSYKQSVKKTSKKIIENCTQQIQDLFRNIFHPDKDKRINFGQIRSHEVFKSQKFVKNQISSKIIYKQKGNKDRYNNFLGEKQDSINIGIPPTIIIKRPKLKKQQYTFQKQTNHFQFQIGKIKFLFEAEEDLIIRMNFVDFHDLLAFRYNILKFQMIILNNFFVNELALEGLDSKYPGLKWHLFLNNQEFKQRKKDLENFKNSIQVKISEQYEKCSAYLDDVLINNKMIKSILSPQVLQTDFAGDFKKSYRESTSRLYEISRRIFTDEIHKCQVDGKQIGNKITYLLLMVVICHSYNHIMYESSETLYELFEEYSKTLQTKGLFDFNDMRNWMIYASHENLKKTIMRILPKYFVIENNRSMFQ